MADAFDLFNPFAPDPDEPEGPDWSDPPPPDEAPPASPDEEEPSDDEPEADEGDEDFDPAELDDEDEELLDLPPEPPVVFDDRPAKELLRESTPRAVAGERLASRLYARRVSAPGSARRAKLFERLGIGDPWDADTKERAIALGPVGTRLDEKRAPAPHAVPKAPVAAGPKTPNVPKAPPAPRPPPTPAAPAAKAAPPTPPKPTGPIDRTPPPPKPPPRHPAPIVKSQTPAAGRSAPKPSPKARPAQVGGQAPPIISAPAPKKEEPKFGAGGRLRMAAQTLSDSGPRVIPVPKLEEKYEGPPDPSAPGEAAAAREQHPPEPEVSRKPPGGDLGLDDLFGFAQNEGRMRIRRSKKGEDEPKPQ